MPIPGGSSIVAKPQEVSVAGFNKGTLGAWVKIYLSQEPAFLSNGHVLPKVAVDVYHPDTSGEIIGAVLATGYNDRIDAAIGKCSLTKGLLFATKRIGADFEYRRFADPQHDEAVTMVGAVSGIGVADVNLATDKTHCGARCFELVRWGDYLGWGAHGDSGSVVLNCSEDIVGLYWGSAGNRHYAHYISDVARILGIEPL